jgi:hypothetical protein
VYLSGESRPSLAGKALQAILRLFLTLVTQNQHRHGVSLWK